MQLALDIGLMKKLMNLVPKYDNYLTGKRNVFVKRLVSSDTECKTWKYSNFFIWKYLLSFAFIRMYLDFEPYPNIKKLTRFC